MLHSRVNTYQRPDFLLGPASTLQMGIYITGNIVATILPIHVWY